MHPTRAVCLTDAGRSRNHNEDCHGEDAERGLWVVADGMGGHAAGEVASQLAVAHIQRLVARGRTLAEAIQAAHAVIRKSPSEGVGSFGMGTTVVAAHLTGGDFRVCWVGDSRAYLHDGDRLTRISTDHSYVQHLLDSGAITAEEADAHPERSAVTQCLGADELATLDVGEAVGKLYKDETLLLCTDGLTGEVGDEDIAAVLGTDATPADKARRLIDMANANGGSDNITVVLIPAPGDAAPRPAEARTRELPSVGIGDGRVRPAPVGPVLWAGAALLAAVSVAGWFGRDYILRWHPATPAGGASIEEMREAFEHLDTLDALGSRTTNETNAYGITATPDGAEGDSSANAPRGARGVPTRGASTEGPSRHAVRRRGENQPPGSSGSDDSPAESDGPSRFAVRTPNIDAEIEDSSVERVTGDLIR